MVTKIEEIPNKTRDDTLSQHEQIIKEQLESWIADIYKNEDLEKRLQKAFESDKTHVQSLSEL